jgi:uncharacterized protein
MLRRLRQIFWQQRKSVIFFISVLVGVFFVIQIYLNLQITKLTIAAGPARGESYQLALAISEQLAICESSVRLEVLETKGSEQNLELLQAGKVDLASIPVNSSVSTSVKLVSYLFEDLFQIVVSDTSGIQQIADLKGKQIAIPAPEDRGDDLFWILLKHYRLSRQDLTVLPITGAAADEALLNNKIDAIFRLRPAGNKFIQKLVQQGRARIIPIDRAAALKVQYPELKAAILPKGVYQGNVATPAEDLETIGVRRVLVANRRAKSENIYEMIETIYENHQILTSKMPLANEITAPELNGGSPIPIHVGAANYYNRSEPDFLAKNSDQIGLLVTIIISALSWLWQLREKFTSNQKNCSDLYNKELIHLMEDIRSCNDLDSLDRIKQILYHKFAVAIDAFDRDRITFESLQSIRFTWDATMLATKDRETALLRQRNSDR